MQEQDRIGADRTLRRRSLLALLCSVQFLLVFDGSVVTVALPSIQDSLNFSQEDLQWVVSAYAIPFGGFLLLAGRAADLYGRKRLFVAGLSLFTLASLACGLAWSAGALLIARAIQGFGAALVAPAALSVLTTTFPEGPQRNVALSAWSAFAAAGATGGLIIGGVLTASLGWEWVFFASVPVGAMAVALAIPLIPATRRTLRTRLDLAGALAVTTGLVLLVYALTGTVEAGYLSARTISLLFLSLALLAAFRFVEERVESPLVPFRVFRSRPLSGANLVLLALTAVMATQGFLSTLYLQRVLGYSALETGFAFLPAAISAIASASVASRLVGRFGSGVVATSGMALFAVGMLLHARISTEGGYVSVVLPAFVVFALALGFTSVAARIAATSGVEDAEQGLASGILSTTEQIGPALGLAILVTLATAYTSTLSGDAGAPSQTALVTGYRLAFVASAVVALGVAAVVLPFLHKTSSV